MCWWCQTTYSCSEEDISISEKPRTAQESIKMIDFLPTGLVKLQQNLPLRTSVISGDRISSKLQFDAKHQTSFTTKPVQYRTQCNLVLFNSCFAMNDLNSVHDSTICHNTMVFHQVFCFIHDCIGLLKSCVTYSGHRMQNWIVSLQGIQQLGLFFSAPVVHTDHHAQLFMFPNAKAAL